MYNMYNMYIIHVHIQCYKHALLVHTKTISSSIENVNSQQHGHGSVSIYMYMYKPMWCYEVVVVGN